MKMLLNIFNLVMSIVLATCLVILQETMSNMLWLVSVDMPVSGSIFFSAYFANLFAMNLAGSVPLIALTAIDGTQYCIALVKPGFHLGPIFVPL